MAHFAVGFFALGLLTLVLAGPAWFALLLVIPVIAVGVDHPVPHGRRPRHRDRAHAARQPRRSPGTTSTGCGSARGSWAYAQLKNGGELRLPAVTFATLPLLTEASGGRVPNPYE